MAKRLGKKVIRKVEAYIKALSLSDYDKFHIPSVEKHIVKLAQSRGLDVETARAIALLHDIGRIEGETAGHGRTGARLASDFLKKHGVCPKNVQIISRAILNHTKKKKVHDAYSELIKDADSLAHFDENGTPYDAFEALRCKYADSERISPLIKHETSLEACGTDLFQALEGYLSMIVKGEITSKTVHDTRVCIRKLRTVIWLLEKHFHVRKGDLKPMRSVLGSMFKRLEPAREIYVCSQYVKKAIDTDVLSAFDDELAHTYARLSSETGKALEDVDMTSLTDKFLSILKRCSLAELDADLLMEAYVNALVKADLKKIGTVHKLRIEGKKIKYLIELDIVEFDDELYQLIKRVHDSFGDWHDIGVNLQLIKTHFRTVLTDDDYAAVQAFSRKRAQTLITRMRPDLLELRLRLDIRGPNMAGKLCKVVKKEMSDDDLKDLIKQIDRPKFICSKCMRTANKKSFLCFPKKM